jgi:hypothetical protein
MPRTHGIDSYVGAKASYERYGVLQWGSRLKIGFCEIFGSFSFRLLQKATFRKSQRMSGLLPKADVGVRDIPVGAVRFQN